MVSAASVKHLWQNCERGVERPVEVDMHGLVEALELLAFNGPDHDDAGVVNDDADTAEVARDSFNHGANFERLVAVKRKYDPENLFRVNQNINPSA